MLSLHSRFSLLMGLLLVLSAVQSFAQTGPQAALIPACVKGCDPAAIASVNCTNEDQYCHCVRQQGILSNISACANAECDNPSRDIYVFSTLFREVCRKFNISVSVLGNNGSANGTNLTVVPVPFVAGAGKVSVEYYLVGMTSGLVGVMVFVVLL